MSRPLLLHLAFLEGRCNWSNCVRSEALKELLQTRGYNVNDAWCREMYSVSRSGSAADLVAASPLPSTIWFFWVSVTSPIGGLPWCFEPTCGVWLLASERKQAELLAFRRGLGRNCTSAPQHTGTGTGSTSYWWDALDFLHPSSWFLIPLDCMEGRNCFCIFEHEQCDCKKPSDLFSTVSTGLGSGKQQCFMFSPCSPSLETLQPAPALLQPIKMMVLETTGTILACFCSCRHTEVQKPPT